LRAKIAQLNNEWLADKRTALIWSVKTYGIEPPSLGAERPRASILHLSQDLIQGADGEVWISAGDMSWLKEHFQQKITIQVREDGAYVWVAATIFRDDLSATLMA
jgi:hypothetical protein